MKAERKNFKGIEYVLFDELPKEQQEKLVQTLSYDVFIKILMNGKVVSKCIQYHDYQNWFDKVYKAPVTQVTMVQKPVAEKMKLSTQDLALNKF